MGGEYLNMGRDDVGTMMVWYVQVKVFYECLEIYDQMVELKVKPDNIAFVAVSGACVCVGKLEKGKEVHEYIERRMDSFLCTTFVDFYAKCGCIGTAIGIFETSKDKHLLTWNAILVGFAMHGHGEMLLSYFSKMVKNRVKLDEVTFLGVLVGCIVTWNGVEDRDRGRRYREFANYVTMVGCNNAGLIDEARGLFDEMESVYGVPKELKHYGCMADLLGRAGLIKEAINMIENMPMAGDVFVWGSLLGDCRLHGNVEVAEKDAEHIMEISPEDGGVYSTMADIYANAKRWDDLTKIRSLRDSRRVNKNVGCSLLQLDSAQWRS
ncbi:pentatricopeptide repeat (PPR) superfamily protein [Artemisia annua]|uniref:Pentatricopeptide repeat (PPR) superfamily protein n=1 Tax=Artemisia annua TaxID=35608 RepID=A0A2U1MAT1_ARTAN|nr:pentatricopeptide repeat (PPR) superfamily protein [Artemisia annua]